MRSAFLIGACLLLGAPATFSDIPPEAAVDIMTLSPVVEIDIPDKTTEVTGDINIGLMGNGQHVTIYNLTPVQSVTVIDVESRQFAAEISTPGCAMILPVKDASFLMVCGDGTVQLIRLADGFEPLTTEEVNAVRRYVLMDPLKFRAELWRNYKGI